MCPLHTTASADNVFYKTSTSGYRLLLNRSTSRENVTQSATSDNRYNYMR